MQDSARVRYSARPMPRFWSKVAKAGDDECWLWTGRVTAGRARFRVGGKDVAAARFLWTAMRGPIGDLFVLHRCDNPMCVNPAHLFLGTNLDNQRDKSLKGRTRNGVTAQALGHVEPPVPPRVYRDLRRAG